MSARWIFPLLPGLLAASCNTGRPAQLADAAASSVPALPPSPATIVARSARVPSSAAELPRPASTAASAPARKAVGLALGSTHQCVLLDDGQVACWGTSDQGALGQSTSTKSLTIPALVPGVTQAISIAAGNDFTCVALRDGGLQCWGRASHFVGANQDTTEKPCTSQDRDLVEIAAGNGELVGRLRDGHARMWESMTSLMYYLGPGMNRKDFCPICNVSRLSNVTQIAAGGATFCAVLKTGQGQLRSARRTNPSNLNDTFGPSPAALSSMFASSSLSGEELCMNA